MTTKDIIAALKGQELLLDNAQTRCMHVAPTTGGKYFLYDKFGNKIVIAAHKELEELITKGFAFSGKTAISIVSDNIKQTEDTTSTRIDWEQRTFDLATEIFCCNIDIDAPMDTAKARQTAFDATNSALAFIEQYKEIQSKRES